MPTLKLKNIVKKLKIIIIPKETSKLIVSLSILIMFSPKQYLYC